MRTCRLAPDPSKMTHCGSLRCSEAPFREEYVSLQGRVSNPPFSRQRPLARYSLDHPPTAQDYAHPDRRVTSPSVSCCRRAGLKPAPTVSRSLRNLTTLVCCFQGFG